MFSHIDAYPGDPILGLNEAFGRDPRAHKVNLSIGLYVDDDGRLPVMRAVREAEAAALSDIAPRPYLPMAGTPAYRDAVQALVFGEDRAARREARIATLQTLGGGGALRVGADFLKRYFPDSTVWISDPSWDNHRVVFESAGFPVQAYPYYDDTTGGLRFDAMLETLAALPRHSIVLLHACCHNPTGVDLTQAQWQTLAPVLRERGVIAFVDMAYQGFGDGLEADAFAVRTLADAGVPTVVANSFSKNFSLYGERCGALSVVCASADEASRVFGQLTGTVRANYSNPPTHGARLVARVLGTPALRRAWEEELGGMRERIATMRAEIHARLAPHLSDDAAARYIGQRGMFTYTGLSAAQADALRETHGVYVLRSGRMCVAGLNTRNVDTVARAIAQVLTKS
ncbi:aspartate/tyrosine/aromatic aminotransferase [Pandoraea nosoerga]|uniref:Aromatic amino acid aminotransferase n=1 Tax=Pandoraea nosoerga TaxID=2508296 RepID=A0A5E4Y2L6_9BURK|nr:amino acid aminotransferase [Pandoraea nosoerga]MBN4667942.1 aspartate/tyrosine/aromatic aminotransferase [Pandoraea nosoerga]MBN4677814.1 aspartate/tyrosine/aromatic aminotransferase [Pandoraea nosoerga]MBN4682953.1 aspartate/tyrosine/aromatic aminotransferase [Pandoraea nosoerga]MBN4746968.1 aspartate/tyrosine/aromatic aminotransferase [Pandoraea nosoerga]VVE42535.1 aromatic amino acid aminotransferase [Pandoraea nosoerga]